MSKSAPSPFLKTVTDALDAAFGRPAAEHDDTGQPGEDRGDRAPLDAPATPIEPPLDAGTVELVTVLTPEPVIADGEGRDLRGAPRSTLTGPPARVLTAGITATISGGGAAVLLAPASATRRRVLLAVVQDPTVAPAVTFSISPEPRQDNTGFRPTVAHGVLTFETGAPIYGYVTTGAVLPAIVSVWIEPRD